MFITNKEKDWMKQSIQILQQQVRHLAEKTNQSQKICNEDEAPWGLKSDGTPRKRPGRPPVVKP
jgi:hypothetical protein